MSGLTKHYVDTKVKKRRVMMFAKSTDPDSEKAKEILDDYHLPKGTSFSNNDCHSFLPFLEDAFEIVDIEKRQDCKQLENYCRFLCLTDRRQVLIELPQMKPQTFVSF